ncbi:MAG: DUF72 domain-containing protein, partial [Bryobacteraceae bacterium]
MELVSANFWDEFRPAVESALPSEVAIKRQMQGDATKAGPMVGCCGWTEAQSRYMTTFQAIELQTTFYQPPSTEVAERWKALAPPQFCFCMKAWQLITHTPSSPTYRRLKSAVSPEESDLYGSFRPTEQVWLAWERTR